MSTFSNAHVISCDSPPSAAPTLVGQHWVDTTDGGMWFAVGTTNIGDWVKIVATNVLEVTVPATTTQSVYTKSLSDFMSADFQIACRNASEDKHKAVRAHVTHATGGNLEGSVYATLGDLLDFDLNFNVVGSDLVAEVVNNEAFDLTFKLKVETV